MPITDHLSHFYLNPKSLTLQKQKIKETIYHVDEIKVFETYESNMIYLAL